MDSLGVGEVCGSRNFVPANVSAEAVRQVSIRMTQDLLPDVELLQLHLAADDRSDDFAMAERLIERFGGLVGVLAADVTELLRHVGAQSVVNLKLLREIVDRVSLGTLAKRQLLTAHSTVAGFLAVKMRGLPREEFWVLFLDKCNQLIVVERISVGTVDHAPVYVREVLRRALEIGASAMILGHNHPSGDPTPSRPDIEMTKAIMAGAKSLGLHIWDHMIVGSERVLSLKAEGLM